MRPITLVILVLVATAPPRVNAIVDPTPMVQDMERRIAEIKDSRAQITDSLVGINLAKDERKQLEEWRKSLDEEQEVLEKRLELFKKLQNSGIITYITPDEKQDTKTEPENSK